MNRSAEDVPLPEPTTVDTVVAGAGPAGLAVGACLRRAGVPFIILERADRLASAWHTHYDRLHLHTVKRYSALPYLPFPTDYPRYPSRLQVIDYLEAYARRFRLVPRFGEEVQSARLEDGNWLTQTDRGLYLSRRLVVATGYNHSPNLPTWPGQERFGGTILHSSQYHDGEAFRGKRVLVVGLGNSGGEIAIDLREHGARTSISVRGGVNIVPRDPLRIPIQVLSIFVPSVRPQVTDALTQPLWRALLGDLSPYGLRRPSYGPRTGIEARGRIPVIDVGTVRLVRNGQVRVHGPIERFTPEAVVFADGQVEPFDAVVLATGYQPGLDQILAGVPGVLDGRGYPLVSGRESAVPGLYFCGFRNVATGLLREIGREARRIARDISRTDDDLRKPGG